MFEDGGTAKRPRRLRESFLSADVGDRGGGGFDLVVIEGADVGLSLTIDSASTTSSYLIGSSPASALRIIDRLAHARHCSLRIERQEGRERESEDALRLIDHGGVGSNTRVNGLATSEAILVGGEVIRIGDTLVAVKRAAAAAAVAPVMSSFGKIRGESVVMRALYPGLIALAAEAVPSHVLIEGERGTGKRLLAEELLSGIGSAAARFVDRASSPDIWAAIVSAVQDAHAIYVREASDLDEEAQTALAHLIRQPRSSSSSSSSSASSPSGGFRVILGNNNNNKPLAPALVNAFALHARVNLPPLRTRDDDVPLLARHFWSLLDGERQCGTGLPDDFVAQFDQHAWPGNVRELRIAVQDCILHGRGDDASGEFLTVAASGASRAAHSSTSLPIASNDPMKTVIDRNLTFVNARSEVLAEFERRYVDRALDRCGHNVARAAAASGIAHRYFQVIKSRRFAK